MDQKMVVLKPKFYSPLKRQQYILLPLETWSFCFVSLAANFWSSLVPCLSRQWSLAPDTKICAASLQNSPAFKCHQYIY